VELSADLIRRAQGGDSEAQVAFLRAVSPSLRALLRRLGFPGEAQDELQDVYTKLLDVLPQFRLDGPAQPGTWVYSVVHRWLLEKRRKRRLQLVSLDAGLTVADSGPSPAERASSEQLRGLLERAIRRLPEDQQRVLVFTQLHQQPLEAFAAVEGLPLGTVKSRLHRARAELAALMGEALDEPGKGGPHAVAG
jgi:RNA polymerase sigma-70 factor (ECF subfamily)